MFDGFGVFYGFGECFDDDYSVFYSYGVWNCGESCVMRLFFFYDWNDLGLGYCSF